MSADTSLPPDRLLKIYDEQLRGTAGLSGATSYEPDGPLWRGAFGSRGFVTYRDLGGLTGSALDALITRTVEFYTANFSVTSFEWKTRGHDLPADLPERLVAHGLVAEEQETVMLGEVALLAVDVPIPLGVHLRRIDNQSNPLPDLLRAAVAQERAFGMPFEVDELVRKLQQGGDSTEFWIAEVQDEVVTTGRLEVIPGTQCASVWGGGTVPEWRGKGLYRALTAERAKSALRRGVRFLHSDSTEFSRPILQRSGLVPVTTTTPFIWTRT